MGDIIHARLTDEGNTLFRLWSTTCDSYISEEMTEKELRKNLLGDAILEVVEKFDLTIDERIKRTIAYGTSDRITKRNQHSWDEELNG